jgi:tRNA (guanine37-N1)-methyltransferase
MSDTPRSHGRLTLRASARPRELGGPAEVRGAFVARIITLFPEAFPGTLGLSLVGRARDLGLWRLETLDLRGFGEGRHRNVDDSPAGGGAGMVLRADVVARAFAAAAEGAGPRDRWPLVYLSPRGAPFSQARAAALAAGDGVTLLCGRFEGVDQRVLDAFAVEEISLGDFVMTGGEIAAQAVLDAVLRLRPGVLGNAASTAEESFAAGLLEHPQFTRPAVWEGRAIPPVLLSGNHAEIAAWRRAEAERLTAARRPDLWARRRHPDRPLDPGGG